MRQGISPAIDLLYVLSLIFACKGPSSWGFLIISSGANPILRDIATRINAKFALYLSAADDKEADKLLAMLMDEANEGIIEPILKRS